MELLNILAAPAGIALGLFIYKIPNLRMLGWLIACTLGYQGILAFFTTSTIVGALSKLRGNPDEHGIILEVNEGNQLSNQELFHYLKVIAGYLLVGLLVGTVIASFGYRGFGPAITAPILAALLVYKYGWNQKIFALTGVVALGVYLLSLAGIASGPVVFISLLSGLGASEPNLQVISTKGLEHWKIDEDSYDPYVGMFGIMAGMVPGLNGDSLLNHPMKGWLATIMSEGISLAVLLSQRSTSKTTLTTYLSQFSPSADLTIAVIVIVISLLICINIPQRTLLNLSKPFYYRNPPLLIKGITVVTVAGFINIAGQPLLSLILATALYGLAVITKETIGPIPPDASKSLVMAPIIFS
jgi:MFS family permease